MFPKMQIDLAKLTHNIQVIQTMCDEYSIELVGVTKSLMGNPRVAEAMMEAGMKMLADSRCDNLENYQHLPIKKMFLRLPMLSEVDQVVRLSDVSLHSEVLTIQAINQAAMRQQVIHDIMIMVDMGDLREGIFYQEELDRVIDVILDCSHLRCIGIGTNLSCYGGLIPTQEILEKLVALQQSTALKIPTCTIISGGNSSSLHVLMTDRKIPPITQLRVGESLFLGVETAYGERIANTYDDVCVLDVEVIEVKYKPSAPKGKIGKNAFGFVPKFENSGKRHVCICAVGLQDTDVTMTPLNPNLKILGASSDHLLVEILNGAVVTVGDVLRFKLSYSSLLRAAVSRSVLKEFV